MRKIGYTTKITTYAASMLLSIGVFGLYNSVINVPPAVSAPEIPIINLDTISPVIASTDYAQSSNPFGKVTTVAQAGAGIAKLGMGPGVNPPTPPGVPAMPSQPGVGTSGDVPNVGENYQAQEKLTVLGVLPPDVVILSKGGKTVTARSGSETEFGTVGEITSKGAYVDDTFYLLK